MHAEKESTEKKINKNGSSGREKKGRHRENECKKNEQRKRIMLRLHI